MADDFIETYGGRKIHFLYPRPEDFTLEDVAFHLSRCWRFNGGTRTFYSVAQHSLILGRYMDKEGADELTLRTALFHDASEAFLPDVAGPMKRHLPDFREMEDRFMAVLSLRFDFTWPIPKRIRDLDARIVRDERDQLRPRNGHLWECDNLEPLGIEITGMHWKEAERVFLEAARILGCE